MVGGTSAGKSFWVKKLLENAKDVIHPPPERKIYCYGEWQSLYQDMKDIEFEKELTESLVSREYLQGQRVLLIIDDLADSVDSKLMSALFTKYSHP